MPPEDGRNFRRLARSTAQLTTFGSVMSLRSLLSSALSSVPFPSSPKHMATEPSRREVLLANLLAGVPKSRGMRWPHGPPKAGAPRSGASRCLQRFQARPPTARRGSLDEVSPPEASTAAKPPHALKLHEDRLQTSYPPPGHAARIPNPALSRWMMVVFVVPQ